MTTKTATLAPLLLAPVVLAPALSGCSGGSTSTESAATSASASDSTTADTASSGESSSSSTTDDGPPPPPGEVQVLTYNVAGLPQGISSSKPDEFMPLISPLLNAYELVLVQEDFYYHAQLAADVTHPYRTTPWMEPPDVLDLGDGLNRFSIYPMDLHERIGWGDCNGQLDCASDCLATKGWSFARTTLYDGDEGKVEVDVYNLHMEAGGCPEDVVIRQKSCENLAAEIMARSVSAGYPVIVAGDFNLRENDPEDVAPLDALMTGAGLTDACQHLDCGDIRIDKVLYRDGADVTLEARHWEVPPEFVSPEGEDLSDHLPVAVRLAYTPQ